MIEPWQYLATLAVFVGFGFLLLLGLVIGALGVIGLYYAANGFFGWVANWGRGPYNRI